MRIRNALLLFTMLLTTALAACSEPSLQSPGTSTPTASGTQTSGTQNTGKSRLSTILGRGKLACGVSGELPGFSFVSDDGNYAGLDVDICRAVAAALFDDPGAVEFRNLNAKERFTAVQTGEVDLLSRNTTLTLSRDTSVGMEFAPVVFYDGQGIMVKKAGGFKTLEDLKDKSICIQTGTTTEQNLADQMRKRSLSFAPVVFEDVNATFAAYTEGRCDAITADRSQLLSRRTAFPNPADHTILDAVLSKEPLAPAIADGDSQWANTVRWVVYALIEAEDLGITSQNVAQLATSSDPTIKRFLGTEGDLGKGMGLTNDFAARIIKHVGNYGEIYDRNLGPKTKLNLPRGINKLWNQGGLLYSPPFR